MIYFASKTTGEKIKMKKLNRLLAFFFKSDAIFIVPYLRSAWRKILFHSQWKMSILSSVVSSFRFRWKVHLYVYNLRNTRRHRRVKSLFPVATNGSLKMKRFRDKISRQGFAYSLRHLVGNVRDARLRLAIYVYRGRTLFSGFPVVCI